MGGDGHSDGADDGSQHDHTDYEAWGSESGYYGGDAWGGSDWSTVYYDYGVDGYAQGYGGSSGDEFSDGCAYYAATTEGGLDETGLYIPPSPMPVYTLTPAELIELKQMIKYQM